MMYLTPQKKVELLRDLDESIYRKEVDSLIIPWITKINSVDGVCTTYSCYGHTKDHSGYLSMMVDEEKLLYFIDVVLPFLCLRYKKDVWSHVHIDYFKNDLTCSVLVYFVNKKIKKEILNDLVDLLCQTSLSS